MATNYPGALDTTTQLPNDQTDTTNTDRAGVDHAGEHVNISDAIRAVEGELGIDPAGPVATTVRERFEILDWKRSCRAASTANVTGTYAAGPPATKAVGGTSFVIDGVTTVNGDRVFLKDQTTPLENGIYQVSGVGTSIVLTRTYDADSSTKLSDAMYVSVEQGTTNFDTTWELVTNNPITLGTDALRYTRVHPAYSVGTPASVSSGFGPFMPTGAILENFPRFSTALTNQAALTTQVIRVFPLGVLRAGAVATALNFFVATTASSGITASWGGIARVSDRVVLARSTNSTSTTAANTLKTFTFSATYTPDSDVAIVGFIMYQATVPSFAGFNAFNALQLNNPIINGTSNTGQGTTPIAVGATMTAFTADTEVPYAYLT